MKLHRIRIEQFRKFNKPIAIEGLEEGLNVLYGPNEAGKSTIASALRTMFLEKHNTKGGFVDDISPIGAGGAAPLVAADFRLGDKECVVSKTFFQRPRAELVIGADRWEGGDADEELATRLGFTLSRKGVSRADTQGIPGLLWIEQGSSSALAEPVAHAASSLAERLKSILGDIASTSGGILAAALEKELRKFRTQTGKSTDLLSTAELSLASATQRRDELRETTREYQALTDRLSRDIADYDRIMSERPWESLGLEKRQAEAQLAALEPQQRELDASRQSLREVNARIDRLHAQSESQIKELAALSSHRNTLANLQEAQQQATQAMRRAEEQKIVARATRLAAHQQYQAAQGREQRQSLQRDAQRCHAEIDSAETTLAKAQAFQEELAALRELSGAVRLTKKDLGKLEQLDRSLRENRIQREAVATRVVFRIANGRRIQTNTQEALEGDGSLLITDALTLHLEGLGEIDIVPGGEDIARLTNEASRLEDALGKLCASLGVADLGEGQDRFNRHQEMERAIALKEVERNALLNGLEASEWQAKLSSLQGHFRDLEQRLAALPEITVDISVEDAKRAYDDADSALTACDEQFEVNRRAISEADLECEGLQGRIKAAAERLEGQEAEIRSQQLTRDFQEAVASRGLLQEKIGNAETALAALRPDDLAADIRRVSLAIDLIDKQRAGLRDAIAAARVKLETLGADGLEEKLAAAEIEVETLEKRLAHYRLRADALTLLCTRLEAKQDAAIQRLYAPLRLKLDHYLQQLFPGSQVAVEIDELRPAVIARDHAALALEQHSHGTREQLGVIARFAYADLLKEAGQPTLIILDDALVHSDEARRQQMKRILHDASQRHQILLFTCHPEDWRDAGAKVMIDVARL